jgi:replicative DNA helicase
MLNAVQSFQAYLQRIKERPGLLGLSTGFPTLDKLTGGLIPGEVTVLAGRTSMGKTALAMQIAWNAARDNHEVLVLSLEMPGWRLIEREVCRVARIPAEHLRLGIVDPDQIAWMEKIARELLELPLTIYEQSSPTKDQLRAALQDHWRQGFRPKLLVVDHLGKIIIPRASAYQQASEISAWLVHLAKQMNAAVLALCQLNRAAVAGEEKRPQLHHLRDSGAIEQDADAVWLLHRPSYYREEGPDELIVAKSRNGATGEVKVTFDPEFTEFWELKRSTTP